MAFGMDMNTILKGLAENESIKAVIGQVEGVCNGVVKAMAHFNGRFDAIEAELKLNSMKLDKVLFELEHPSEMVRAGDDGLMQLLADGGEEMRIQEVEPLPEETNSDGSPKVTKLIQ